MKISDLPYSILFEFKIDASGNEIYTTQIDDILQIKTVKGNSISSLDVDDEIVLSDNKTYKIENIGVFNINEYLQDFKFGTLPVGITSKSNKKYLLGIKLILRQT